MSIERLPSQVEKHGVVPVWNYKLKGGNTKTRASASVERGESDFALTNLLHAMGGSDEMKAP